MALAITSITGGAIVGFTITIGGATVGRYLKIYRQSTGPVNETVRGADFELVTGATMVFVDYEAHLNLNFIYQVEEYTLSNLVTPTASTFSGSQLTAVTQGFAIITDPLDAAQRVAGAITDFSSWTNPGRVKGRHEVLGRRNPLIVTDVQGGMEGTFSMSNVMNHTVNYDGAGTPVFASVKGASWDSIFVPGTTLLFRSQETYTGVPDFYFKATGVTTSRMFRQVGQVTAVAPTLDGQPATYDIAFTEVDRPLTTVSGLATAGWEAVYQANMTGWSRVNSTHADWLSVLNNPGL